MNGDWQVPLALSRDNQEPENVACLGRLEPVAEDWQKAVAVVAHPDDLEFGGAAAIARWTDQGKEIIYCIVTSGEAGMDAVPPDRAGQVREGEQLRSAALVGVETVEFLGQPDGLLEYGISLRRELARVIRRHQPEIIITTNFRDTWDGDTVLNQADHVATGRALLDAVRDAANRWIFSELGDEGIRSWSGVREVWAACSPKSRHGVDVTSTFDRGVAALNAHAAYLRGLGSGDFDAAEFLEDSARATGLRMGCQHAIGLEVFPFRSH